MASNATKHIEMRAGEAKTLSFTATDEDGDAIDLADATIEWWMATDQTKKKSGAAVSKNGSITSAAAGTFTVSLTASDTKGESGIFYHEAKVTNYGGSVVYFESGYINVMPSVGDE